MQLHTLSLFTLLTLLPFTFAIDYISTYNLATPRWDATLTDTPNNITCTVTYQDTSSLLLADADGYLSSAVPIALPCGKAGYSATVVVGKGIASVSYTTPGKEAFVFESGERTLLGDGEVIMLISGVEGV